MLTNAALSYHIQSEKSAIDIRSCDRSFAAGRLKFISIMLIAFEDFLPGKRSGEYGIHAVTVESNVYSGNDRRKFTSCSGVPLSNRAKNVCHIFIEFMHL
jgi:hypothetical protein